jgi:nitroimidazol reductase NimA-like FMN-containing flavoprotein (pyridoxamine 5'-phosphate oxidase superfamily)
MSSAPASSGAELREMSRAECLQLLAAEQVGRLAVNLGEGPPVIRPLNFAFDESSQSIVFRTGVGSKLHATIRAKQAAFEVDGLDHQGRTGWSVIVQGLIEEITEPREIARLERLGVEPWSPGDKSHWVQLRARTVSGRRLVADGLAA